MKNFCHDNLHCKVLNKFSDEFFSSERNDAQKLDLTFDICYYLIQHQDDFTWNDKNTKVHLSLLLYNIWNIWTFKIQPQQQHQHHHHYEDVTFKKQRLKNELYLLSQILN